MSMSVLMKRVGLLAVLLLASIGQAAAQVVDIRPEAPLFRQSL